MKHFNNPIGLLLLLTIAFNICLSVILILLICWTYNTQRNYKSETKRLQPQTIVEVVEKENCVKCEVCPPCTYLNTEAIPLENQWKYAIIGYRNMTICRHNWKILRIKKMGYGCKSEIYHEIIFKCKKCEKIKHKIVKDEK